MHATRMKHRDTARRRHHFQTVWRCLAALVFLAVHRVHAADLNDLFADRTVFVTDSGTATGNNTGATLEPREPRHGGKPGGHSLWMSWVAPATGIATFDTDGSGLDTLLGVYTLDPGDKIPMDRLRLVLQNDDHDGLPTSRVQFGVVAGTAYEIAIDGFDGAVGPISVHWNLVRSDKAPPIIVSTPGDRALREGDTLSLTVGFVADKSVKLAWFLNGNELLETDSATLVVPNVGPANLGLYQLRLTANGIRFFTDPAEIQINSEGQTNALARNKLVDSLGSPLRPSDDNGGGGGGGGPGFSSRRTVGLAGTPIGVTRGYDGTQIFNTAYAGRDPAEPQHCGLAGGASYWFAYEAPTNGVVSLDTAGSSYDTILAVYTFEVPLLGYQSLVPVACDHDGAPDGTSSRVAFAAVPVRTYLVVVDGMNGAKGVARLHYHLAPDVVPPVDPPSILVAPLHRVVAEGGATSLSVDAAGTAPLSFQWLHGETPVAGATNPVLALVAVAPADGGEYSVRISNERATIRSPVASVGVFGRPAIRFDAVAGAVVISFPVSGALRFQAERSDALDANAWTPWDSGAAPGTSVVVLTNAAANPVASLYRIRFDAP